jgi:hypothetical protein
MRKKQKQKRQIKRMTKTHRQPSSGSPVETTSSILHTMFRALDCDDACTWQARCNVAIQLPQQTKSQRFPSGKGEGLAWFQL